MLIDPSLCEVYIVNHCAIFPVDVCLVTERVLRSCFQLELERKSCFFFLCSSHDLPTPNPKPLKKRDSAQAHNSGLRRCSGCFCFPLPPLPRHNGGGWWCSWCIGLLAMWFFLFLFLFPLSVHLSYDPLLILFFLFFLKCLISSCALFLSPYRMLVPVADANGLLLAEKYVLYLVWI